MKELSISELETAYKAMTPGEWRAIVGSFNGPGRIGGNVLTSAGPSERWSSSAIVISNLFTQYSENDFAGIAACHNAIPLLLEIGTALMDWANSVNSNKESEDKLIRLAMRLRP